MRTERSTFAQPSQAPARFRRRVEKPNAASGLGGHDRRGANASAANSASRESIAPSHFETCSRSTDFDILPVSGFVAQIVGQMMNAGQTAPAAAVRAYAQAKAGSRYQRPLKYA